MRPHHVALVGCGKSKAAVASEARNLYTSTLFRASLEHAEACAERVFIVSALHGLIHPDTVVEPYDRSLFDLLPPEQNAWTVRIVRALGTIGQDRPVLLLAGGLYETLLSRALYEVGWMVERPLHGRQIGERLHWLKAQRERAR